MQFLSAGFVVHAAPSIELDKTRVTDEAGPYSTPIKKYMFSVSYFLLIISLYLKAILHIYHVSVLPNVEVSSLHSVCPTQCYVTLMHP